MPTLGNLWTYSLWPNWPLQELLASQINFVVEFCFVAGLWRCPFELRQWWLMLSLISLERGGMIIVNDCWEILPFSISSKNLTLIKIQVQYFNSSFQKQPQGKKVKILTLYTVLSVLPVGRCVLELALFTSHWNGLGALGQFSVVVHLGDGRVRSSW